MATPKQEYIRALRDISKRFDTLEADTVRRSIELLRAMRDRLQLRLTSVENFRNFQLSELIGNVNQMIAEYEAQLIALSNGGLTQSARLGALSVVEPLQAAGVGVGFFQPTPAQLNTVLDFSADLIRGITGEMRQAINGTIRRSALGEQSTISAMQEINRRLGVTEPDTGIAYRGERIIRTELGRVYNLSNHSQQQVTAQQVDGLQKQWLATGDARTRIEHLAAHGQLVPVDQPFMVGREQLMYPLDPAGSAWNTINCRCRSVTVHPEIGPIGGPLNARIEKERKRRAKQ